MIAESLLRILNKLRGFAVEMGSFHVPLPEHGAGAVPDDAHLPAHDAVLSPLLAHAEECRVYGVPRKSELAGLLKQIGEPRDGAWHLDISREIVRNYESLWNAQCEHRGIVIVSRPPLGETQKVFDYCGNPDVWGGRAQLREGNAAAAVSHCCEVVKSGDAIAFLIPGSNGLEWIDVFADKERIGLLWDQAIRKRLEGGRAR